MTKEEFQEYCKHYLKAKEENRNLCAKMLNQGDIDVCNYIISVLPHVDMDSRNTEKGKEISVEELIDKSLSEIKILGDDIYFSARKLTTSVPIYKYLHHPFNFMTMISYPRNRTDGRLEFYLVPETLYEASSLYFGHEQLHALKDTSYLETIESATVDETIPLFYELLKFNPEEIMKTEYIQQRLKYLGENKRSFLYATELIEDCDKGTIFESKEYNRDLYEYVQTEVGSYLNSFYYALMLYSMYKETPKKILGLISKVLKQEITTIDMLNQLGIYCDIRGEVFEKELNGIVRCIK